MDHSEGQVAAGVHIVFSGSLSHVSIEDRTTISMCHLSHICFCCDCDGIVYLKDLRASLEEAAADAMSQSGFVYDDRTGLYYDWNTGYYYDPVSSVLSFYLC